MSQKIMLNFKLILLGDANTGKTAILNQYIYHTFTNTKATTGIDYFTKLFEIEDFIVKLNIFDTAGQERYLSMTKSYFRGANAALFTYSLIQKQSFFNLSKWIKQFQDQAGHQTLKIVVGTKKDLKTKQQMKQQKNNNFPQRFNKQQMNGQSSSPRKRSIEQKTCEIQKIQKNQLESWQSSEQQMKNLMKNQNITFTFETSALLNQNIDQVFEQICKYLILKEMNKSNKSDAGINRQRVQTQFSPKKKRSQEDQDQKLSLQQKISKTSGQKRLCC